MKVSGIGNVTKQELMSILTKEGRDSVKDGTLTLPEVAEMYRYEKAKQSSKIGAYADTFRANYDRIPQELREKLSPQETASLVDAFYDAYSDGKSSTVG